MRIEARDGNGLAEVVAMEGASNSPTLNVL